MKVVAILGRPDEPTDGVEDHCVRLSEALAEVGIEMKIERVHWATRGWRRAMNDLVLRLNALDPDWVIFQYTALAWSRRAFPLQFLWALQKGRQWRRAVVFHDPNPFPGTGFIAKLRRQIQTLIMRRAVDAAHLAVLTVDHPCASWVRTTNNVRFIPIGSHAGESAGGPSLTKPEVVVFGVTEGPRGVQEARLLGSACRYAAERTPFTLVAIGRGSAEVQSILESLAQGANFQVRVSGLVPEEEVERAFATAAAVVFLRGELSTRRSSAISAIGHQTPLIGYQGPETCAPLLDAGVVWISQNDESSLVRALSEVLTDEAFTTELRHRNQLVFDQVLSWKAIAHQWREVLDG